MIFKKREMNMKNGNKLFWLFGGLLFSGISLVAADLPEQSRGQTVRERFEENRERLRQELERQRGMTPERRAQEAMAKKEATHMAVPVAAMMESCPKIKCKPCALKKYKKHMKKSKKRHVKSKSARKKQDKKKKHYRKTDKSKKVKKYKAKMKNAKAKVIKKKARKRAKSRKVAAPVRVVIEGRDPVRLSQ